MPSKLVIDRDRSARAVDAARVHLPTLVQAITATLTPYLRDGESVPDTALLVDLYLRRMTTASTTMVNADDAHLAELADDPAARDERDQNIDTLTASLNELRQLVTGLHGPAALTAIHLTEAPAREPLHLQRTAADVARTLPAADLGPSRLLGVHLDTAAWATRLDAERQAVASSLQRVAIEGREAEHTLGAKHNAISAFDDTFAQAANLLTLLLQFADQPKLADRIRPSGRKPGRRAVDEEAPASDS